MRRRTPNRAVLLSLFVLTAVGLGAAAAGAQPTIISTTASDVGPLVRTEAIVQVGPNPIDTFRMTRLARDVPPDQLRGSILFLPSLGTSFTLYEQRDASGAVGTSVAEFFALRGYDVFGYSPRFEGIPAGSCELGLFDCSVMAGWDLQSMLDDVSFIRDHIESIHPGGEVVAGGLSLGGILAVAVANADGARYAGVFPWEGMLLSDDPAVQALNTGYCNDAQAQLAAGFYFDAVGTGVFKTVAQHAAANPEGLTPIPLFPPFLTNRQVLVTTLAVPTPGAVSMPVPGYILTAGDPATGELFFASARRLLRNVLTGFNNYTPTALTRDIPCALAGIDDSHTANLGAFTGSVLMIGGGRAFGGFMQDQLDAFTGASDRRLLLEPDFGHVDHFFSPRHRRYVERPILRWLRHVLR
jgi:hypothetical protein